MQRRKRKSSLQFILQPSIWGAIALTGYIAIAAFGSSLFMGNYLFVRGDDGNGNGVADADVDADTDSTTVDDAAEEEARILRLKSITDSKEYQDQYNSDALASGEKRMKREEQQQQQQQQQRLNGPVASSHSSPPPTTDIPDNGKYHEELEALKRDTRPSRDPVYSGHDNTESASSNAPNQQPSHITHESNNYNDPEFLLHQHQQQKQQQQQQQYLKTPPPIMSFQSLFTPHQEEYDLLKFDPYSFSGAPLGGWGRATRSRLASLPIRLVSDFDGGIDMLYSTTTDDNVSQDDDDDDASTDSSSSSTATKEMEINPDGSQSRVGDGDSGDDAASASADDRSNNKHSSSFKDLQPSSGPHFTIHDGTGQQYVCRVYADEELVVTSRVDSMFLPAVTIWDEDAAEHDSAKNTQTDENADGKKNVHLRLQDVLDGKYTLSDFDVEDSNDEDGSKGSAKVKIRYVDASGKPLPDSIRKDMAKLLKHVGLDGGIINAADVPVDGDGGGGGGGGGAITAEVADIMRAAAIGAGVQGAAKTAATVVDEVEVEESAPAQIPQSQILDALASLKGICSQLHLG